MEPAKYDVNALKVGDASTPNTSGAPVISSDLLALLKALGGDGAKVEFGEVKGGVIDIGSFKDLKIFNPDGSPKIALDYSNPEVAKANDMLIQLYVASLVIETNGTTPDENQKLVIDLIKGLNTKEITPPGVDDVGGKSETTAFLGGLVMVALADILAEFAKMESGIKKLSSVMFLESKACMQDLAEAQAKNTEEKARAQADAKIMQAVVTAVTAGVQMLAVSKGFRELERKPDIDPITKEQKFDNVPTGSGKMQPKIDPDTKQPVMKKELDADNKEIMEDVPKLKDGKPLYKSNEPDYKGTKAEDIEAAGTDDLDRPVDHQGRVLEPATEQKPKLTNEPEMEPETEKVLKWIEPDTQAAQLYGQLSTIAGSMGTATSNLIEARSILVAGAIDADNTRLNFMQEQMGKMQDIFSKMGNDADQKVGEIWDLLKGMFSAITQAFKSV